MDREVLKRISKSYETPAYVFDLDMLRERIRMMEGILGRAQICFAMKANPFLVQCRDLGISKYEVCSPGEFHICERSGVSPEKIVLSGVYKAEEDVRHTIEICGNKATYTIESRAHLELLERLAKEKGIILPALIRVTSGNQFGVDEEEICKIIDSRNQYPHIEFCGLQYYSGTQKKKLSKIEKELVHLDEFIQRLEEAYGYQAKELEYGPGFYVPYFAGDPEVDDQELLKAFASLLEGLHFRGHITLEMGRYIAAYCGYYLTRIVDQKINKEQRYAIVDGGIHHLSYFGQMMAMKLPHYQHIPAKNEIKESDAAEEWNICGSLCTVNDVIVKQLPLISGRVGDLLVFERVGAYSVTEGIYLFLSRNLPQILTYEKAEGVKVLRPEIASDMLNDGSITLRISESVALR